MKNPLLKLSFAAVLLLSSVYSQGKLTGTVTDGLTNNPLPGANVFIESTSFGAAADAAEAGARRPPFDWLRISTSSSPLLVRGIFALYPNMSSFVAALERGRLSLFFGGKLTVFAFTGINFFPIDR